MKGGFQILDLSGLTIGTEAAVNNAFKTAEGFNNKAILVLPPAGGSVYCQLNKSSDNYVGAYVGADGATYNIIIKPNNNVTVTKTEAVTESDLTPITASIMSIGGQVEDLQAEVDDFKKYYFVDSSSLSKDTPFTVPSDGIVTLTRPRGSANSGKSLTLSFKEKSSNLFMALAAYVGLGSDDYEYTYMPVKKGQVIKITFNGTGETDSFFYPYVD